VKIKDGSYAPAKYRVVVNARIEFRNVQDFVAQGAEPVDNLLVDTLVRYELHPAIFSKG
jgi:ribosomal protein S16